MKHSYLDSVIYKLYCLDPLIKDFYIGGSIYFQKRKLRHRDNCINPHNPKYNIKVYKFIRNNGGWGNWTIDKIKNFPCNSKKELEIEETKLIQDLKSSLNQRIRKK